MPSSAKAEEKKPHQQEGPKPHCRQTEPTQGITSDASDKEAEQRRMILVHRRSFHLGDGGNGGGNRGGLWCRLGHFALREHGPLPLEFAQRWQLHFR